MRGNNSTRQLRIKNDQILDGKSQSPNEQEKDSECRQNLKWS